VLVGDVLRVAGVMALLLGDREELGSDGRTRSSRPVRMFQGVHVGMV